MEGRRRCERALRNCAQGRRSASTGLTQILTLTSAPVPRGQTEYSDGSNPNPNPNQRTCAQGADGVRRRIATVVAVAVHDEE